MFQQIRSITNSFSHIFFPHNCEGCGTDILHHESFLCAKCFIELPTTNFFNHTENLVEKVFYGRIKVEAAASGYYFSKQTLMQHLIFELKYKGNKQAGTFLGNQIGKMLLATNRFDNVDAIIPVPLNAKKENKRGYNQAQIIAEGIVEVWHKPIIKNVLVRKIFTETQTHKHR